MIAKTRESRFNENVQICSDWATITEEFDALPKPVWRRDEEGEMHSPGWIFRGHKRASYTLEPSIERAYPYRDWAETEYKILREFQRSEERRVGKECRSRWGWEDEKKKGDGIEIASDVL